jgi:hypothetical protein
MSLAGVLNRNQPKESAQMTYARMDICLSLLWVGKRYRPGFYLSDCGRKGCEGENMLWTIFVILLVLWILGFSFHVAGSLIHILLVIALIVLVVNLVSGRRSALWSGGSLRGVSPQRQPAVRRAERLIFPEKWSLLHSISSAT